MCMCWHGKLACLAKRNCWICLLTGNKGLSLLSRRLPADVDEVARRLCLAWLVGLEISKDLVLQFTMKGPSHQLRKALQTMRVVGETEFTEKDTQSIKASQTPPNSDAGLLFIVPNAGVRRLRDLRSEGDTETSQWPLHKLLHHTFPNVQRAFARYCWVSPPAETTVQVDLPDFRKVVEGSLWHVDGVVQGDHVRFTVDPQHWGSDVLSEIALQQTHDWRWVTLKWKWKVKTPAEAGGWAGWACFACSTL